MVREATKYKENRNIFIIFEHVFVLTLGPVTLLYSKGFSRSVYYTLITQVYTKLRETGCESSYPNFSVH